MILNGSIKIKLFKSDLESLVEGCYNGIVDIELFSNKPDTLVEYEPGLFQLYKKEDLGNLPF